MHLQGLIFDIQARDSIRDSEIHRLLQSGAYANPITSAVPKTPDHSLRFLPQ